MGPENAYRNTQKLAHVSALSFCIDAVHSIILCMHSVSKIHAKVAVGRTKAAGFGSLMWHFGMYRQRPQLP